MSGLGFEPTTTGLPELRDALTTELPGLRSYRKSTLIKLTVVGVVDFVVGYCVGSVGGVSLLYQIAREAGVALSEAIHVEIQVALLALVSAHTGTNDALIYSEVHYYRRLCHAIEQSQSHVCIDFFFFVKYFFLYKY